MFVKVPFFPSMFFAYYLEFFFIIRHFLKHCVNFQHIMRLTYKSNILFVLLLLTFLNIVFHYSFILHLSVNSHYIMCTNSLFFSFFYSFWVLYFQNVLYVILRFLQLHVISHCIVSRNPVFLFILSLFRYYLFKIYCFLFCFAFITSSQF